MSVVPRTDGQPRSPPFPFFLVDRTLPAMRVRMFFSKRYWNNLLYDMLKITENLSRPEHAV